MDITRERLSYDVLIVGAGPSGLFAAISLAQKAKSHDISLSICLLEKGSNVGAHLLSGAVIETAPLDELIPNWRDIPNQPLVNEVTEDRFYYLSQKLAYRLPTPPYMHNKGNYIVSMGVYCRFLADIAQSLGVEIYTGFCAKQPLIEDNRVIGVVTGDMGIDKEGKPKSNFTAGIEIVAKQTLLAEGCRGSLSEEIISFFNLREACLPQTYAIGLKEIWEVTSSEYQQGRVEHSIGWPLSSDTYGGSFVYHLENKKVAIGLVVGLDYKNPNLSPFDEFQQLKHHPKWAKLLTGGQRIEYGARALNEGGYQSIPKLSFPGGLLLGCAAGFMNVPKIKGSHNAMRSGLIAAQAVFEQLQQDQLQNNYQERIYQSKIVQELKEVRNIRPSFKYGLGMGLLYSGLEAYIFKGRVPWTFAYQSDYLSMLPLSQCKKIDYPKPDGKLSFDKLTSVSFSNTFHEENQPCHLLLKNPELAIEHNYKIYGSPETRYCPAGVYEIVQTDQEPKLQINAQNCIHCKTCDIKDMKQNIKWVPPMGGGGPNYREM